MRFLVQKGIIKNAASLLLLAPVMFLAACQSTAPLNTVADKGNVYKAGDKDSMFYAKQQGVAALNQWNLSGSFSYRVGSDVNAGSISWSSKRDKQAKAVNELVNLRGPLGVGSVSLYSNSEKGAVLVKDKQDLRMYESLLASGAVQGFSAEYVLFREIGWHLPIQEMRYWMYGVPHPEKSGEYVLDEKGSLINLEQSGWNIRFSNYQNLFNAANVQTYPRKVFATNKRLGVTVKLVIKKLVIKN